MREGFFKSTLFGLVVLGGIGLGVWAYIYQHQLDYDPLYDAIDPKYLVKPQATTTPAVHTEVEAHTPAPLLAAPSSGTAPLTVNFTQTATDDWRALIEYGDGTSCGSDSCSKFTHTYTNPGTYTASLRSTTGTDGESRPPLGTVTIVVQ